MIYRFIIEIHLYLKYLKQTKHSVIEKKILTSSERYFSKTLFSEDYQYSKVFILHIFYFSENYEKSLRTTKCPSLSFLYSIL